MPKSISVVGEPFLPYVNNQISYRQSIYGSGINGSRKDHEISYLNSRNAWIKFASAVNVLSLDFGQGSSEEIQDAENRLRRIFADNSVDGYGGSNLSKDFVLFNGTSTLQENGSYSRRAGVTTNTNLASDAAYGLGGTEFGIQPMPGITSFNVVHRNNGALRDGTITITAYNRFQFDIIETLYLRLGFTMLVEWGNNIYYPTPNQDDSPSQYEKMGTTLADNWWFANQNQGKNYLQILDQIENTRKKYTGNYDAFVCVVSNFKWSVNVDGTYEIEIQLVSLGSVIEGLKIDILHPRYQLSENNPEATRNDTLNKNSISNWLYTQRTQRNLVEEWKLLDPDADIVDYLNLKTASSKTRGNPYKDVDEKYIHYVRLGTFLQFIQDYILPQTINGEECFPSIEISTTNESICNAPSNLVSTDPRVCLIRPDGAFLSRVNTTYKRPPFFVPAFGIALKDFFIRRGNESFGIINNIYLNFDLIERKIGNESRKVDLLSFLNSILDEVNSCFGGYLKLYTAIDEVSNQVVIRDENLKKEVKVDIDQEGTCSLGYYINSDYSVIEWLGYNRGEGTSNFLTGFSFETFLSNNVLNTISIGAVAANQTVNEDSTAYEKWSSGLLDGYKRGGVDGTPDGCEANKGKTKVKSDQDPGVVEFELIDIPISQTGTTSPTITTDESTATGAGVIVKSIKKLFNSFSERQKEANQAAQDQYNSWEDFIFNAFEYSYLTGGNIFFERGDYFNFDEGFISRGKKILSNEQVTKSKREKAELNSSSGIPGFLPAELSLTLDGISGIRIYNGLKLNTKLLPYNYPEALDFIIIGVDHSLAENDWQTTLRAVVSPSRYVGELSPPPAADIESLDDPRTLRDVFDQNFGSNLTEPIVIYPPTNIDPTAFISALRNDAGGQGHFSAPRGGRPHRGIDLATTTNRGTFDIIREYPWVEGLLNPLRNRRTTNQIAYGTRIYAPITGIIQPSKATTASKLPGAKIIGNNEYAGITVYIFYMRTDLELKWGRPVTKGDTIGYGIDLSLDYPPEVGNHIHFAIKTGTSNYLDPQGPLVTYSFS